MSATPKKVSPFLGQRAIIRSKGNVHRYICYVDGRIKVYWTDERDIDGNLASLFGTLNNLTHPQFLRVMNYAVAFMFAVFGFFSSNAWALPTGWDVVSGDVQFQQNGNVLNITSNSSSAIVNYQSFNIGTGETVNFNLTGSTSSILNNILGVGPSQIGGIINSNGQVFLVNAMGIDFTSSAQVNVGGILASTLPISNTDYLSGNYRFKVDPNQSAVGVIRNAGRIETAPGGYVSFNSQKIENSGSIIAPNGSVSLAVGDQITVHVGNDLDIDVTVDQSLTKQLQDAAIENSGLVQANNVKFEAALKDAIMAAAVNNGGIVKATHTVVENGKIRIVANSEDHQAVVKNTGTLDASGQGVIADGGEISVEGDTVDNTGNVLAKGDTQGVGGNVYLLGTNILNHDGALIDVSGDKGGGTALIGGDYQGNNPFVRNALFNYFDGTSRLNANAISNGNGGKAILWSDDTTIFEGNIEAKGGQLGGNGGFVETSGHNLLRATGLVNASSPLGLSGKWLLDPNNIMIQNAGGDSNISCAGGVCTTTDDSAIVTTTTINAALNSGTDITIQTSNAGTNAQSGDITFAAGATINKTSGADATLTLKAHNSIFSNGTSGNEVTISSSSNKLNVVFNADSDAATGGAIALSYMDINSNGGNITLGGGANPFTTAAIGTAANNAGILLDNSHFTAGAGNVAMRGTGYSLGGTSDLRGISLTNGSQVSTTSGNITFNGTGGAGLNANYGINLDGSNVLLTTQTGAISLTGQGGNGTGNTNNGINLHGGAQVTSTGAGTINLTGTAGTGSGDDYGVRVDGVNSLITSSGGAVSITGTGGGDAGTSFNFGVDADNGGKITTTGNAALTVAGTGGAGANKNAGISVRRANSAISTVNGAMTINGTGGAATGNDNYGVSVTDNGKITKTGTGNLNITGTSNGTGAYNFGVNVETGGQITNTSTGILNVSGTGGGGTSSNIGVAVRNANSLISTAGGNATITGQGGTAIGNDNYGVRVEDTGKITSSGGTLTINGTGSNGSSYSHGVDVASAAQITTTNSATLNITGTGGNGVEHNYGVSLRDNGSLISVQSGNMTVIGQGGNGSGQQNKGIVLASDTTLSSTGTGDISLTGTGGTGTTENYGAYVRGTLSTVDGDVSVTGQGGNGSSNYNSGTVLSFATVSSSGSGTLSIDGTGATGTSDNYGIDIYGSSITGQNGDIILTGQGGSSGSQNYGVVLESNSVVTSNGSADITVDGTGGTGTASQYGILVDNSTITGASTGSVSLVGQGGSGTGASNIGILLQSASRVRSTGSSAATVSLDGTGGGAVGSSTNYGVLIDNTNSKVSSIDGDITVVGQGGGQGGTAVGVYLNDNAQIESTGNATITVNGTGGGGSGTNNNYGVYINGTTDTKITSATGNINVTGHGGDTVSGVNNYGMLLQNGGRITSTGTAALSLSGTGGVGSNQSAGVVIDGSNSIVTSAGGNISVTGQGSLSATGNQSYGLYLQSGHIENTGNGTVTINATGGHGTANIYGAFILGALAYIRNHNGNMTINAQGGAGTGDYNDGLVLGTGNAARIYSSGTGTLTINATGGGTGAGSDNNFGAVIEGGVITSATGNINLTATGGNTTGTVNDGLILVDGSITSTGSANLSLTGIQGNGTGTNGIRLIGSNNALGSNTMTGDLTITTDKLSISDMDLYTAGVLMVKPYTASTSIGINSATGTLSNLQTQILANINTGVVSPSSIVLGDAIAGTGTVTIGTGWNPSALGAPVSIYGGNINTGSITMGNNRLLLSARTGDITIGTGSTISSSAAGNAITLAAGQNIINDAGAGALNASTGRWLVYANNPTTSVMGGLLPVSTLYGKTLASYPPASVPGTGNTFIFSIPDPNASNSVFEPGPLLNQNNLDPLSGNSSFKLDDLRQPVQLAALPLRSGIPFSMKPKGGNVTAWNSNSPVIEIDGSVFVQFPDLEKAWKKHPGK